MNYQSIQNYVAPVISFYKINDIMLNSKKINRLCLPKLELERIEVILMKRFKNY